MTTTYASAVAPKTHTAKHRRRRVSTTARILSGFTIFWLLGASLGTVGTLTGWHS